MKKLVLNALFVSLSLYPLFSSEDYSFSMDEIEKMELKSYDFSGYLKAQHKHQKLNEDSLMYPLKNKNSQETYLGEIFLNYKYFHNQVTFNSDLVLNYKNIDNNKENSFILNQAFLTFKYDNFNEFNIGKKTAKWGKGYFSNPIAFIDRKKDPNEPEANKEGFIQLNYKFNKVYQGNLQNVGFDFTYIPTSEDFNEDLYSQKSDIFASKVYFLYKDIDIDLAYVYSNKEPNKFSIDFSTNLQTNFEIHGEYAKLDNGDFSYLLGLKYLTNSELTIISEYLYQNKQQSTKQALWDNQYFINKLTQKDPFDILYWNVYFMDSLNIEDKSHQDTIGITYLGIKNLELDFSISKLSGNKTSEYGTKLINNYTWLQIKYSF